MALLFTSNLFQPVIVSAEETEHCPCAASNLTANKCPSAHAARCAAQDECGLACFVPRWLYFWEDIVSSVGEPGQPDACMLGRREVFLEAAVGPDGADLLLGEWSARSVGLVCGALLQHACGMLCHCCGGATAACAVACPR